MKGFCLFFLICYGVRAQTGPACNQSGLIPNVIVPSNTTLSYSLQTTANKILYLCGPNTIVYDTACAYNGSQFIIGPEPKIIIVNAGCIYVSKNADNLDFIYFIVKNGGKINLLPGNYMTSLNILAEPSATVINNSGFNYPTYTCTNISLPNFNCSTVESLEIDEETADLISLYPNPAMDVILLHWNSTKTKLNRVEFRNVIGQTLIIKEVSIHDEKAEIPLNCFERGIYFVEFYLGNKKIAVKRVLISD